jgi:hypothetical protein
MRRLIATMAVMGALIWAYQTGYSARRTLENVAHAQGETTISDPSFTEVEQLPSIYPPRSEPIREEKDSVSEGDLSEDATRPLDADKKCTGDAAELLVDSLEEVKRPLDAKSFTNRFDRGALSEAFDGEIIRGRRPKTQFLEAEAFSLSDPVSAETATPPALESGEELAQATTAQELSDDPGQFPAAVPRKGQLVPVPLDPRQVPNYSDPQKATGKLIAGSTRRVPMAPPRVVMLIGKDHQISVRAESRILPDSHKEIPPGSIIVIAEEFGLVPPTEPAAGNQVTCTGNVQLISQNVAATCAKLTFKGTSLVLEGTPQHRVEVKRQAAGDAAEFQLSADKISFTLSLDKIEIGGGVTVSPAASPATEPVIGPDPRLPPAPPGPILKRPATPPEDLAPASVPKQNFDDDDKEVTPPSTESDDKKAPAIDIVPPVAPEVPKASG